MPTTPLGRAAARLRRNWRALRAGLWFRPGAYRRMDRLYLLEDPWQLASPTERKRFARTNAVIARIAPGCATLLEVGSGEGIQTSALMDVATRVTGIEVSEMAVARARERVPDAEFLVGRAEDAARMLGGRRFDLITACEMLYYAPDAGHVLDALKALSPRILVTAYDKRAGGLSAHLQGDGWSRLEDFVEDGVRWRCHLWRAPEPVAI
jgi:2-polyprenyl-3-methyl-5-hydroxy-6-metoxy-1,4-benzoquinol methylase